MAHRTTERTPPPFCSLACNREYHTISVGGDYPRDGYCLNCGKAT